MCILSSLMLAVIRFTCSIFYYALLLFNRTLIFKKISKLEISLAIYLAACRIPTSFPFVNLLLTLHAWAWWTDRKMNGLLDQSCRLPCHFAHFTLSNLLWVSLKTSNEYESSVIIVHEHWGKKEIKTWFWSVRGDICIEIVSTVVIE